MNRLQCEQFVYLFNQTFVSACSSEEEFLRFRGCAYIVDERKVKCDNLKRRKHLYQIDSPNADQAATSG